MKMSDKQNRCILQTNTPCTVFLYLICGNSLFTYLFIFHWNFLLDKQQHLPPAYPLGQCYMFCVILFCKHPYSSIFCNGIHFIIDWHGNIYKNTLRLEWLHRIRRLFDSLSNIFLRLNPLEQFLQICSTMLEMELWTIGNRTFSNFSIK